MEGISGVDVNLSSVVLNTLNFLLFDLMLAAAVYYLTADLAGLANSMSALQGKEERVSFFSPAIVGVGVGITCTKRRVFYVLAFFRLVSVLLIFISSMSFVGKTISVPDKIEANVTVLGKLEAHDDSFSLGPRQFLREGCQGRRNTTMYYGEIREIRGKRTCELNTTLIPTPIEFDFFSQPKTLNLSACTPETMERTAYRCATPAGQQRVYCRYSTLSSNTAGACTIWKKTPLTTCEPNDKNTTFSCGTDQQLFQNCSRVFSTVHLNWRCQNAIVGCRVETRNRPCKASVNFRSETYLCEGNGTRIGNRTEGVLPLLRNKSLQGGPQNLTNLLFHCKKAKGAEWNLEDWLPHMGGNVQFLEHAYAALYGSGSERRIVQIIRRKKITTISWVWIAIFCFKLAMIVGLTGAVLLLRKGKGCQRVANDEVGLGSLLLSSKARCHRYNPGEEAADSQVAGNVILVEMEDNNVRLHTENPEERAMKEISC